MKRPSAWCIVGAWRKFNWNIVILDNYWDGYPRVYDERRFEYDLTCILPIPSDYEVLNKPNNTLDIV